MRQGIVKDEEGGDNREQGTKGRGQRSEKPSVFFRMTQKTANRLAFGFRIQYIGMSQLPLIEIQKGVDHENKGTRGGRGVMLLPFGGNPEGSKNMNPVLSMRRDFLMVLIEHEANSKTM